jgi:hypothetical protein
MVVFYDNLMAKPPDTALYGAKPAFIRPGAGISSGAWGNRDRVKKVPAAYRVNDDRRKPAA